MTKKMRRKREKADKVIINELKEDKNTEKQQKEEE